MHDAHEKLYSHLSFTYQVMDVFHDGIHGFLFVYNLGNHRYTSEEKQAFHQISSVCISHLQPQTRSTNILKLHCMTCKTEYY